jgi:hypothetical protein
MARTSSSNRIIDSIGNVGGVDILAGYKNADSDENPTGTSYYGFTDTDGNWYIMKRVVTGATATITYIRGISDYSTNWTGRAALTYATFASTF